MNLTAILLAGGSSQRFGLDNKLLAIKNGQPLIHHALNTIVNSQIQRLVIVLGHDSAEVERHCRRFLNERKDGITTEVEFAVNTDYHSGMASSLKTGISYLLTDTFKTQPLKTQATMVLLADMPDIKPTTIDALIEVLEIESTDNDANPTFKPALAIVPTYNHSRGNPVVLKAQLFDQLLDLDADVGARHLLKTCPDVVKVVAVNDSGILFDCDTPDDLSNEPRR